MNKCAYVNRETEGLMITYPFCCQYHLNKARDYMEEQHHKAIMRILKDE